MGERRERGRERGRRREGGREKEGGREGEREGGRAGGLSLTRIFATLTLSTLKFCGFSGRMETERKRTTVV